ncbi:MULTISPECIES: glycosyltransferase [unclassified Carboxylicivirga]|uniref:glycosyltransferase n=1 Tax=Carboxylicivirga TaxID=1628153 RepID=UPI003D33A99F
MGSFVSVIVVTYNSSSFVEETLNSISQQTWPDIELIITDDCSTDNTVSICHEWIKANGHRFVSTEIIGSKINTGVAANANRGLKRAGGQWLCFPAGDDGLKRDCIADNIRWVNEHPEIRVLFSAVDIYQNTFSKENYIKTTPTEPFNPNSIMYPGRTVQSQYRQLLVSDRIHYTPSLFIHRETLLSVGSFDERFKLLEDYPLWLNLTRNGHKLHFMNKVTVNYRQHRAAINNNSNKLLINPNYFSQEAFRRIYIYPNIPIDIKLNCQYQWMVSQLFRLPFFNKDIPANRCLHSAFTIYLNPFKYFVKFRKMLNRNLQKNELYN